MGPRGGLFLSVSAIPLVPEVPIEEAGRGTEPGAVGLSTSTGFTLTAGDQRNMAGTIDVQFAPAG